MTFLSEKLFSKMLKKHDKFSLHPVIDKKQTFSALEIVESWSKGMWLVSYVTVLAY